MEEDAKEKEAAETPSKKSKKLIIIGIIIFFFISSAAILSFVLIKKSKANKQKSIDKHEEKKNVEEKKKENEFDFTKICSLEPFILNIVNPNITLQLKLKIELEFISSEYKDEIEAYTPNIRDMIITTFSVKKWEEISSVEAKILIKNELIVKINELLKNNKIRNLYFTEFHIQ